MQPEKEAPVLEKGVYLARGAHVSGNVVLRGGANVWPGAVLRGDVAPIEVGRNSNVQDNCTLHCTEDLPLRLGENVTVGHNAVLHSCTVGDGSLIGMGAVVLDGARVGKGCLVAAGALVPPRAVLPDGTLFMGSPAREKRALTEEERESNLQNAARYVRLAAECRRREAEQVARRCVRAHGLRQTRLDAIRDLEELCGEGGRVHIMLNWAMLERRDASESNDLFYFENGFLAGYLGLFGYSKNAPELEASGMVAPDFRRRGIFRTLLGAAEREAGRRGAEKLVLAADCGEPSGAAFACSCGYAPERTELMMRCESDGWEPAGEYALMFRKASLRDAKELAYLDMLCFGLPPEQANGFYEEGLHGDIYIAQQDGRPVGKVGVADEETGSIFGLAVAPGCRRRGYGREILDFVLGHIFENSRSATLEVDERNRAAIALYESAGFETQTRFCYFAKRL